MSQKNPIGTLFVDLSLALCRALTLHLSKLRPPSFLSESLNSDESSETSENIY